MSPWELLTQIQTAYQAILGSKLTGIYVHGSLAFGCFCWEQSDIDFLVVVENALTQAEKEALIRTLLALDSCAPSKGFEMSVLLRSACSPFKDPTPYELHYSNAHRANYQRDLSATCRALQGFDPDLAAHITVINAVGLTLCGQPVDKVFSPVPKESYLRSLWYDIENAPVEIGQNPVYYILNLCRVMAYACDGLVCSKADGGVWGIRHLPEHAALIAKALAAYRSGDSLPSCNELRFFAEEALERIAQNSVFLSACFKKD